jgi:hypothetical protein
MFKIQHHKIRVYKTLVTLVLCLLLTILFLIATGEPTHATSTYETWPDPNEEILAAIPVATVDQPENFEWQQGPYSVVHNRQLQQLEIYFSNHFDVFRYKIFDLAGDTQPLSFIHEAEMIKIGLSDMDGGTYILQLIHGDRIYSKRVYHLE